MEYYKDVELSIDVLHVNRIPFLATLSKNIHYSTMDALDNMKIPTMEHVIETVIHAYAVRGFHVKVIHVDIQFKALLDREKLPVRTNIVSRGKHVPEIERYIRVLKERARYYFAILDEVEIYTLPRQMVIHLMITVNFYMNTFVWRKGVSQILPPITIVTGLVPDFKKHFHVLYGEYCNTYKGTTNTMKLRTVGALALGPSGNTQGGVRCYSLRTGKILNRMTKDITIAKMPDEALGRLKYITKKEKAIKGLIFGNRNNDDVVEGVMDGGGTDDNEGTIVDHVNHPSTLSTEANNAERQTTHFDDIPDDAILEGDDDDNANDDSIDDQSDDDSSFTGVFPANAEDEFQPNDMEETDAAGSDSDDDDVNSEECTLSLIHI